MNMHADIASTPRNRVPSGHTFGGEIPLRAQRRNKEYLLNSLPTIESATPAFHGVTILKLICWHSG